MEEVFYTTKEERDAAVSDAESRGLTMIHDDFVKAKLETKFQKLCIQFFHI